MPIQMKPAAPGPSLQIQDVPLDSLHPYPGNPRIHDHAVPQMVALIKEFGFTLPILKRGGEVVDGHLRLRAAQEMKLTSIPAIDVSHMSEAQVRALRLSINKSVEWADWDADLLRQEIEFLSAADFDLGMTGFDTSEIDALLKEVTADVPKTSDADAGDPADPNYVSMLFHMSAEKRVALRARLDECKTQHGLSNRSQALLRLVLGADA